MSRYRPPRTAGSPYITPEGERALRDELHALWKIERPDVTKAVSAAAANGDRSENGDYIYGKKRLREIDSRVRFPFLFLWTKGLWVQDGRLGLAFHRNTRGGGALRSLHRQQRIDLHSFGRWTRRGLRISFARWLPSQ